MQSFFPKTSTLFLLLILILNTGSIVSGQESSDDNGDSDNGMAPSDSATGASGTPASSGQGANSAPPAQGHVPLPASYPSGNSSTGTSSPDSSLEVTPPSVTIPTPDLPPPPPLAEPTPSADTNQAPLPLPTPAPQFNPPSAQTLNLPSGQPAGNPTFAPASVGVPNMSLYDSSTGPGALSELFDWAKKLRFQAALRAGYDDNVNSGNGTNVIASTFANLYGGVNYRFGAPRLNINLDLTGGVTRYFNSNISQPLQGTMGLGLNVEYRSSPRLVFTFDSSSSYQQQPNITLIGAANNSNDSYYYTANSLAGSYQWSDLFTTVTRFNLSGSYYPAQNDSQGFADTGFTQSFRYLLRPTTTAVLDYNADEYTYRNTTNNSFGQYVAVGFDHTFNPKWFWNFRFGAETRTSQSASTYIGPYVDSNFSWLFGRKSSVNWVLHYGTQPDGQNNGSYTVALRTGLSYTQGILTRLSFDVGLYYLLNTYNNAPDGPVGYKVVDDRIYAYIQNISYNQTNLQGNVDLVYNLNRIIDLSIGYQYLTQNSPSVSSQDYNRGITYFQIRGGF